MHIGGKAGQVLADGIPDDVQVHSIIGVAQTVSHAPNIRPRLPWHQTFRLISQAVHCFTDALQAALDGVTRAAVSRKLSTIELAM